MKNILWIYNRPLNPEAGGTERITSLIMKGLSDSGHLCLGMLVIEPKTSEMSYQDNPVHDLSTFLKEKKVDVVINQDALSKNLLNVFLVKGGKEWHSQGGRLITCLHFDPKSPGLLHLFQSKRNKSIQDWITILNCPCSVATTGKRRIRRLVLSMSGSMRRVIISSSFPRLTCLIWKR